MVYNTPLRGYLAMNVSTKLLKIKLLWTLSIASFIPMVIIALYSYQNIKNQIISSELSHLDAILKLKSIQIERFYDELKNDIFAIQCSPYTKIFLLSASSKTENIKELYEQQLNHYLYDDEINQIYILDLSGKILARSASKEKLNSDNSFDKKAFEEGKRKIYFSEMYQVCSNSCNTDSEKRYLFSASAPILDYDNKLIGVVVIEFSANLFFNQIQDYSGLGESGETLLGKQIGDKVIFLNPLRHDPNSGMKRSVPIHGTLGRPAILGATGHVGSGESIDYRGVKVLAAWRYVPIVGWGMVAKIDESEAFKALDIIRNSILSTVLIIFLIGLILSLRMTKHMITPVDVLEMEAHMDALTGLPNRKMLMHFLEQSLNEARLKEAMVAIMFLDLDGFKGVNDCHGHDMGDQLLKNVALRLGNAVRQSDTVARLGGDEFIILLPGAQDTKNIEKIARTIINTLNEPFIINKQTITVGVSIGISVFPDNALEAVTMIKQADKAMYEAKNGGKNNYKFSEESES